MKLLLVLAPLVVTRADFVLVDWATDWYTARDYCRENHVDLASIHSEEDNTAVTTACADMSSSTGDCERDNACAIIGVHAERMSGLTGDKAQRRARALLKPLRVVFEGEPAIDEDDDVMGSACLPWRGWQSTAVVAGGGLHRQGDILVRAVRIQGPFLPDSAVSNPSRRVSWPCR